MPFAGVNQCANRVALDLLCAPNQLINVMANCDRRDPTDVSCTLGHLQQNLRRMKHHDESVLIRIAIAINEALTNAIYHGNLEVSSELLERDDDSQKTDSEHKGRTSIETLC